MQVSLTGSIRCSLQKSTYELVRVKLGDLSWEWPKLLSVWRGLTFVCTCRAVCRRNSGDTHLGRQEMDASLRARHHAKPQRRLCVGPAAWCLATLPTFKLCCFLESWRLRPIEVPVCEARCLVYRCGSPCAHQPEPCCLDHTDGHEVAFLPTALDLADR